MSLRVIGRKTSFVFLFLLYFWITSRNDQHRYWWFSFSLILFVCFSLLAGHILSPYLLPLFLFSPKLPWTEKGIKYTTPNPLPSLLLSSPFYCLSKQFLSPSPSSSWAQGARKLHLSLLLPAMWCHCCSPAQPSWSQSSPVQCPSNNRKALFSIGALQSSFLVSFISFISWCLILWILFSSLWKCHTQWISTVCLQTHCSTYQLHRC